MEKKTGLNAFFKKSYTSSEVDECFNWFQQHIDQLPATLSIEGGLIFPDLRNTVNQMMSHLKKRVKGSPVYNGQFSLLLLIRDKVQALENRENNE